MAEIVRRKRGKEYRVEWIDNNGQPQARLFKTKAVAERYALRIEMVLFNDVMRAFTEARGSVH